MSALTKEEILQLGAVYKTQAIEVPELGGAVFVREVTAKEYIRISHLCGRFASGMDERLMFAECCAYFLSDAEGKRLFMDNQFEQLGRLNANAMQTIFKAGLKFNGLSDDDPVNQAIEDAEKN